jgi:hypothetical protein
MSTPQGKSNSGGRFRAYVQFVAAVLYFFLAEGLARHGARGLASEQWFPLAEQAILAFLLLLGYSGMGFWLNRQMHPVSAQGLPRRTGWPCEAGLGLAVGWSLAVVVRAAFGSGWRHRHFSRASTFRLGLAAGRCGIFCAGRAGEERLPFADTDFSALLTRLGR